MDIEFTLKIKDEQNPNNTEFRKGVGKGVLVTQIVSFNITEEELKLPINQCAIQDCAQKLIVGIISCIIMKII